jgi:hypothetical protein
MAPCEERTQSWTVEKFRIVGVSRLCPMLSEMAAVSIAMGEMEQNKRDWHLFLLNSITLHITLLTCVPSTKSTNLLYPQNHLDLDQHGPTQI